MLTLSPIFDENDRVVGASAIARDITELKRTQLELAEKESQLLQMQKMEAIGNLAGGVAHGFNNMLNVILGYGQELLDNLHAGDPFKDSVNEIVDAGKRSAALTRQLLAFSRKQTLQPEILDLNTLIKDLEKML